MPIPPGKLPVDLLARLLGAGGSPPSEVLLGPAVGEDACVIDVPAGALVVATDPITLTSSEVGRYAVIVNANDVAVTGARPRWFLAAVLLPVGTGEADVEELFAGLRAALAEVGATLVGGHTEVTPAVNGPVVVGQMLGMTPAGCYVTTSGARPGDVLVQVGAVPVEGAAVLATEMAGEVVAPVEGAAVLATEMAGEVVAPVEGAAVLATKMAGELGAEAAGRFGALDPAVVAAAGAGLHRPGISVVEAALAAAALGATAMHDPTEGGLASGLHELATASGVALRVDRDAVVWFEPGVAVCRAVGADPWSTLASGCLLAAFPAAVAEGALAALAGEGHPVARLGRVEEGRGVVTIDGDALPWPDRDEVARLLV